MLWLANVSMDTSDYHVHRTIPHAGSDLRIMLWFSHFSMNGMSAFKYGAFALAHYTLAYRDEVS